MKHKDENKIISFLEATPYSSKDEENGLLFSLLKLRQNLQLILNEEINMPDLQCPAFQFEVCKDSQGYLTLNLTADNKHYELDDIVSQANIIKAHIIKYHPEDKDLSERIEKCLNAMASFKEKSDSRYITMGLYVGKEDAVYIIE